MTHELKILPEYFEDVLDGIKTFEIRKNDRNYKVGDKLLLREFKSLKYAGRYTGREMTVEVVYMLNGGKYGLEEGYCILGIE